MYTPGEVVYHRGDITTSMYYIRSGKVKVNHLIVIVVSQLVLDDQWSEWNGGGCPLRRRVVW